MKLTNIKYLDTGKGLSSYSKLCKEIYDKYTNSSKKNMMEYILGMVIAKN